MPRRDAIACEICSEPVQRALAEVSAAIQARRPRDWRRLCHRVQRISWLPEDDGSTLGEWFLDREYVAQLRVERKQKPGFGADDESDEREEFLARGWIGLSPRVTQLPPNVLRAVVAHEFGHAVTRPGDIEAREVAFGDAEWATEACADMYAFRWGFEEDIRAAPAFRDVGHHGALPGEVVQWDGGPAYRVDRYFFPRRLTCRDSERAL